ncbi:6889_t:CDS:2, partial [Funneliformis mosseae]
MVTTKIATEPTDFRTASITQHWNDPPQKIFHKVEDDHKQLDSSQICLIIQKALEICKDNAKNSDKKIILDTEKRLEILYEKLESKQLSESVLGRLGRLCE